jgi:predicted DNA-binding transcriptional regulator AlpA
MKLIGEKECYEITGLSRTTRWAREKDGSFPKKRVISSRRVGWISTEIEEWMNNLPTFNPVGNQNFSNKSKKDKINYAHDE